MEGFKSPGTEERTYELKIIVRRDGYVKDELYDFSADKPAQSSFLNFLKDLIENGVGNGDKGGLHWYLTSVTDKT